MEAEALHAIDRWHDMMDRGTTEGLYDLLDPECVFWSPVVHTPQKGRDITFLYLSAAGQVFDTDFHYVREVRDGNNAMLEFECTMDGIHVNGIDLIQVENNLIIDFKVMVRPLKAVNKVHERMMAMLEQLKNAS
jgi:hypothetical protein